MRRATMERMMPDLGEELNLAPDELDKLLNLLADARTNGGSGEDKVAAMLGSRYPQWQEYQRELPARQHISMLRGQLAASGSVLPESQVKPLMQALTAELQRSRKDEMSRPYQPVANKQEALDRDMQQIIAQNRRMIEAAEPFLNAQQLDSYRKMLERNAESARSALQTMEAAKSSPGGPD